MSDMFACKFEQTPCVRASDWRIGSFDGTHLRYDELPVFLRNGKNSCCGGAVGKDPDNFELGYNRQVGVISDSLANKL